MTTAESPELTLDALGRRCPLPVIMLARRIGEVELGSVVGVLADDEAARLDIPAWCALRGHEYAGERVTPQGQLYLVRRCT